MFETHTPLISGLSVCFVKTVDFRTLTDLNQQSFRSDCGVANETAPSVDGVVSRREEGWSAEWTCGASGGAVVSKGEKEWNGKWICGVCERT